MSTVDRDKLITKIQALWAKASSTDFEAEAEAFAAKAQALMTAYLIEEHEIADVDDSQVITRDFTICGQYSSARRSLLSAVCRANGVYAMGSIAAARRSFVKDGNTHLTLFGTAAAIELSLGLYSKLDMEVLGHVTKIGKGRRDIRAFRFAFVTGFADTIGKRLRKTVDETPGAGLVLVDMRSQGEAAAYAAVDAAGMKLAKRSTRYVNGAGYRSGKQAGANADLGGARFSGRAALPRGA